MTDNGWDPLGRIAEQAAQPYDHPTITDKAMRDYWRRHYADEVHGLSDEDLARERDFVLLSVNGATIGLAAAIKQCEELRATFAGPWDREIERHAAAAERENVRCRLARWEGCRDALAAELARRNG